MDKEKRLRAVNLGCIRQKKYLFTQLSFELCAGQALLIEGPNGSGKSSLIRLATGLSTPSIGDIFWQDHSIYQLGMTYWENLHYVGHTNGIKLGLTVIENLQLAHQLSLMKTSVAYDAVLDLLQLAHYKNTQACYLSAGQKRRLALAKLFLFPKILWILDEPLTALDSHTQTVFLSHLEKHLEQGGISIISSHHPITLKNISVQSMRLASC